MNRRQFGYFLPGRGIRPAAPLFPHLSYWKSLFQASKNGPNARMSVWGDCSPFNIPTEEASVGRDRIQIRAGFGTAHKLGEVSFSHVKEPNPGDKSYACWNLGSHNYHPRGWFDWGIVIWDELGHFSHAEFQAAIGKLSVFLLGLSLDEIILVCLRWYGQLFESQNSWARSLIIFLLSISHHLVLSKIFFKTQLVHEQIV